jgi:predicted  nucleic acid-binding Zn-ribbon protein
MNITCIRIGHIYRLADELAVKQCLTCEKVADQ